MRDTSFPAITIWKLQPTIRNSVMRRWRYWRRDYEKRRSRPLQ